MPTHRCFIEPISTGIDEAFGQRLFFMKGNDFSFGVQRYCAIAVGLWHGQEQHGAGTIVLEMQGQRIAEMTIEKSIAIYHQYIFFFNKIYCLHNGTAGAQGFAFLRNADAAGLMLAGPCQCGIIHFSTANAGRHNEMLKALQPQVLQQVMQKWFSIHRCEAFGCIAQNVSQPGACTAGQYDCSGWL